MASMTELPLIDIRSLLLERDDMDAGVVQQLKTALAESPAQHRTLKEVAETLEEKLSLGEGARSGPSVEVGDCQLPARTYRALCRVACGC